MKIAMEQFKGIAPRYAPKMIPDGMGQIAQDVVCLVVKLRPLRGMTEEGASVADCTKSIYLWKYDYWEMTLPVVLEHGVRLQTDNEI